MGRLLLQMQPVPDPGHHRPGEALLHPLQHRALQLLHLHQQRVLLVVQAGQIVGREVVVELEGRQAWSPAGRIRAAAPRLQSSALAIAQGRCVCIATAPAATSVEARQLHRRKLSWKQEKNLQFQFISFRTNELTFQMLQAFGMVGISFV